jgi:hypothetical protein
MRLAGRDRRAYPLRDVTSLALPRARGIAAIPIHAIVALALRVGRAARPIGLARYAHSTAASGGARSAIGVAVAAREACGSTGIAVEVTGTWSRGCARACTGAAARRGRRERGARAALRTTGNSGAGKCAGLARSGGAGARAGRRPAARTPSVPRLSLGHRRAGPWRRRRVASFALSATRQIAAVTIHAIAGSAIGRIRADRTVRLGSAGTGDTRIGRQALRRCGASKITARATGIAKIRGTRHRCGRNASTLPVAFRITGGAIGHGIAASNLADNPIPEGALAGAIASAILTAAAH